MRYFNLILFFLSAFCSAQKITFSGHFEGVNNKEILLKGYDALSEIELGKSTTDAQGNFTFEYPSSYQGAALIEINQGKKIIVLLNGENFQINWTDLTSTKNLKFTNSPENTTFDKGLSLYQSSQTKKAGIMSLLPYYENEPQKSRFFKTELEELNQVLPKFLSETQSKSYVFYYLKLRFLITDFQLSLKRYPERIPELKNQFQQLDFNDSKMIHSGLYEDLLQSYINVVADRDDHYLSLNQATDLVLKSLNKNPQLKQNIGEYLFKIYEKKSLFEASEHLALQMLSDQNCNLDIKHKALFEQYRKMANGKSAPNIQLPKNQSLFDLKNKYKLVVFGASWCQKCVDEIPQLAQFYSRWKEKHNLEIVFVSLDTQKQAYQDFIKNFAWISLCDFKSWDSPTVTDYCVFATPTMYLLDAQNTIQVKPISAEQIDAWLNLHDQ
ncbi:MAG: TlpA family protein disulfide reductase [Bacteroidetes bacterium]|nr:TlpA family protein disulfide reductase [Bacteroidota bacterium]